MALTVTWEEEYKTSRAVNATNDSYTQQFNFYMCGNFTEEATIDPVFGPDDDLLAIEAAYDIVPQVKLVPIYSGGQLGLVLDQMNLEQIATDTWKVSCTYVVPNTNQGGDGDPNATDYEQWTANFVQLGFNVSSQQETVKMSQATHACQKQTGVGGNVPYPSSKPAPIGLTVDGVEGTTVYKRSFSFNITAYFSPSQLNYQYCRRLFRLATTVNEATFLGFPALSVLFLESNASGDIYSEVPVTFDFSVQPNFKFSQAGPEVLMDPDEDDPTLMFDVYHDPWFPDANAGPGPGGSFSGWDVVDYAYEAQNANASNLMVQVPTLRTIHGVYFKSDFSKLNI